MATNSGTSLRRGSLIVGIRTALTRGERLSLVVMVAVIGSLHVIGWVSLAVIVAPHRLDMNGAETFGCGLGVTAYILGMRHAFDADHLAAIDNTTRKLMADGSRPMTVGFWFSLGHSSVVFLLCLLVAVGVRSVANGAGSESSGLHQIGSVIGVLVSGSFLCLIGVLNLVILVGIVRTFRRMRGGDLDEHALDHQLNSRGLMNRLFASLTKSISRPWQIYPVGVLFGLGFDTASEVGLLMLAGGSAAVELPWYAMLTLPVLFAAGMSLIDSIDGCLMNVTYGWAFFHPVRRVYFSIIVTALSAGVALIIGTSELGAVLFAHLSIDHGPIHTMVSPGLNNIGLGIAVFSVMTWLVALAVWRFGRVEERWSSSHGEIPDDLRSARLHRAAHLTEPASGSSTMIAVPRPSIESIRNVAPISAQRSAIDAKPKCSPKTLGPASVRTDWTSNPMPSSVTPSTMASPTRRIDTTAR